jgi:hypothetical protein
MRSCLSAFQHTTGLVALWSAPALYAVAPEALLPLLPPMLLPLLP